jgi:hypothetical protein
MTGMKSPKTLEEAYKLIASIHERGHFGLDQILRDIWEHGYCWVGMRKHIAQVLSRCRACLAYSTKKAGYHPLRQIAALEPFDHIAIDLFTNVPMSERGHQHVLVVVDVATRFCFLKPLRSKTSHEILQKLFKVWMYFGFPKIIQSDNGKEFTNEALNKLCETVGIDKRLITAYHPQANGLAESYVKIAKNILKKTLSGGTYQNWNLSLPSIANAINTRLTARTGSSPFSLVFGRKPNLLEDYSGMKGDLFDESELINYQIKRGEDLQQIVWPSIAEKARQNAERKAIQWQKGQKVLKDDFAVNQEVLLLDIHNSTKWKPKFLGPYRVLRKNKGGAYELMDNDGTLISPNASPNQLIPLETWDESINVRISKLLGEDKYVVPPPITTEEERQRASKRKRNPYEGISPEKLDEHLKDLEERGFQFPVKRILDHKRHGRTWKFFVEWEFLPDKYNSWVYEKDFSSPQLVFDYWKTLDPVKQRRTKFKALDKSKN